MKTTTTPRTNAKPAPCEACGATLEPGQGTLWWEPGPDDGGDVVGRRPAGWRVQHMDAEACERAKALAASRRAASKAERRERAAAKEAALDAALESQKRQIDELLSAVPDCVAAGYNWSGAVLVEGSQEPVSFVALPTSENPALAGLSLGRSQWSKWRAVDGSTCYVHSFGNASVLHATRAVVEKAWKDYWIDRECSPEGLAQWLSEFGPEAPHVVEARAKGETSVTSRPCAGWEVRAHAAGRLDLLVTEGVLRAP